MGEQTLHQRIAEARLGQRIAEDRVRASMTQVELASAIRLDRSSLAKIESGHRRTSAIELAQIAVALDVPMEWFLQDVPPPLFSRDHAQDENWQFL